MSPAHPVARQPWWWRLGPVGVWLFLAAASVWVLAFNPADRIADPTGPCLWHALTGINGPTCGGTRMFWYLLHGNLIQVARHHLAALAGLLYGLYVLVAWTVAAYGGGCRYGDQAAGPSPSTLDCFCCMRWCCETCPGNRSLGSTFPISTRCEASPAGAAWPPSRSGGVRP